MQNPFSLVFGKNPIESIERPVQIEEITSAFLSENLNQQIFMITGIRGSGKTVLMSQISEIFHSKKDWVVIELNPEADMLNDLASKLCSQNSLASIFKNAKLNLSFFGLGLEIDGEIPITNIEVAVQRMLESIQKQGKRILLTIDEATNSPQMRLFVAAFQIFVRSNIPVCLLMTGLYENIRNLQDEKTLTFLYKSPRIELTTLNLQSIASKYKKIFEINELQAKEMASLTAGYPFAFQTLGFLTFKNDGNYKDILDSYRLYLEEFSYVKIWSELSDKDRKIAYAIAMSDNNSVISVREKLQLTTNEFNPYRNRLVKAGIIDGSKRGYVYFTLPLFKEFIKDQVELNN